MEMSIYDPDAARFTRIGRTIEYWLQRLIDPNLNRRKRAAVFIGKMHFESEEVSEGIDYRQHIAKFDQKVRDVLSRSDFSAADYVNGLVEIIRVSKDEQDRLWKDEQARHDRVADRITAKLEAATEPALKESLTRRLMRASCAGLDCRSTVGRTRHKHSFVSASAGIVFSALGEHALSAPGVIRRMLNDPSMEHHALHVLSQSARCAQVFVDELIERLISAENGGDDERVRAVALAIELDGDRVTEVFRLAMTPSNESAAKFLAVIARVGPRTLEYVPDAVEQLADLAGRDDWIGTSAATAIGKLLARKRVTERP